MNAKNLLKRAACLFSLTGLALSVSAQSRFADAMRQAYAKPERIYQFYVQHQPDSIYKQGEDVFSPYLSSDQFAAQLRAMEERLGDPVEASMWEMQQMAGCEIYSRKITFPRHSATLNVVFDPSGSLLGFTFTDEKALLTETESAHHIYVSDTIQLPARLTMPSASSVKDRVPVVILVHGSGPSNMDESMGPNAPFRDLAKGLSRRGVAVLRYDKRTFVCPQFFANATAGFTYDDETVDDAISAIRLVKDSLAQTMALDPSRIYIVGHWNYNDTVVKPVYVVSTGDGAPVCLSWSFGRRGTPVGRTHLGEDSRSLSRYGCSLFGYSHSTETDSADADPSG